jgi:hypothetical protein
MKIRITAVAIVLAALLAPVASWAVYPSCADCQYYNPDNACTCPGTAPHFIFIFCSNYPAGCPDPTAALRSGKDAFLVTLAAQPVPTASSTPSPNR